MDISFLNEKEVYAVRFQCKITDRRNDETVEKPVYWIEPDCTDCRQMHAWNRITEICDSLGYDIELTEKDVVWRKSKVNKIDAFNAGSVCNGK